MEPIPPPFSDYELLDFGEGRKLERFGTVILDRPCPTASTEKKRHPKRWPQRFAKYLGDQAGKGKDGWSPKLPHWGEKIRTWVRAPAELGFELAVVPRPSGQVGVFPEQASNWQWISKKIGKAGQGLHVLNLFAHTGGSTLAAVAAGAKVTHVDASKQSIQSASLSADASGFDDAPIRWIVEDALKFCKREVRRGNQYDAIILDPPTYGHGPQGEVWSIKCDLLPLLKLCGKLTSNRRAFLLCTCHTPSIGPAELSAYLSEGLFGHCGQPPRVGKLMLETAEGRKLESGVFARWPA